VEIKLVSDEEGACPRGWDEVFYDVWKGTTSYCEFLEGAVYGPYRVSYEPFLINREYCYLGYRDMKAIPPVV
jgi:hypothetical protein